MIQKRLYIGQFNRNGQLVDVTTAEAVINSKKKGKLISRKANPHDNKLLIPNFAKRITKAEYDYARLAWDNKSSTTDSAMKAA